MSNIFVSKPPEKSCPICKLNFNAKEKIPYKLLCSRCIHIICDECLNEYYKNIGIRQCPVCLDLYDYDQLVVDPDYLQLEFRIHNVVDDENILIKFPCTKTLHQLFDSSGVNIKGKSVHIRNKLVENNCYDQPIIDFLAENSIPIFGVFLVIDLKTTETEKNGDKWHFCWC